MQEEWRSIEGFPGYKVSNLGQILSHRKGDLFGHILKPSRGSRSKRALVTLYVDQKPFYRLVARLVCEAFHGKPQKGQQAAHLDGDIFNDTAANLKWKWPIENAADREAHGTLQRGEVHYAAKLSEVQVREIRRAYQVAKNAGRPYGTVTGMAKQFNVSLGTIEDIIYGRKWRHVA